MVLAVFAFYLLGGPFDTWFNQGLSDILLVAERCVTTGDCPLVGPTISDTGIPQTPLFFYVLMPGVFAGASWWQAGLYVLAFGLTLLLALRIGNRLGPHPTGAIAVVLVFLMVGEEYLVEPEHGALAPPLLLASLFALHRGAGTVRSAFWTAVPYWFAFQFHSSVLFALPLFVVVLWKRGVRGRSASPWPGLLVFLLLGPLLHLPVLISLFRSSHGGLGWMFSAVAATRRNPQFWTGLWPSTLFVWIPLGLVVAAPRSDRASAGAASWDVFGGKGLLVLAVSLLPLTGMVSQRYVLPFCLAWSLAAAVAVAELPHRARTRRSLLFGAAMLGFTVLMAARLAVTASQFDGRVSHRLRWQRNVAVCVADRLGDRLDRVPRVHGTLPLDVSRPIEYLLHERAFVRDGTGAWEAGGPAVTLESGRGGRCGATECTEWRVYQPCLASTRATLRRASGDWGQGEAEWVGIDLPMGAMSDLESYSGRRSEGRATAQALSGCLQARGSANLSLPFAAGGDCAARQRAVVIVVDRCAVVRVPACATGACSNEPRGIEEGGRGDTPVDVITIPAAALRDAPAVEFELDLGHCDGHLGLFDVYEDGHEDGGTVEYGSEGWPLEPPAPYRAPDAR